MKTRRAVRTLGVALAFTLAAVEHGSAQSDARLDHPGPNAAGAKLGSSLDIVADLAVGGAFAESNGGAAYVYERDPVTQLWSAPTRLSPVPSAEVSNLSDIGYAVATDGTFVVLSARCDVTDINGRLVTNAGAVWVFERVSGAWSQQAELIAPLALPGAEFGASVDLWSDRMIVGAPGETVAGKAGAGAAYIHERSGSTWAAPVVYRVEAALPAAGEAFGRASSISGDRAAVGAYLRDVSSVSDAGAIDVFARASAPVTWSLAATLTSPSPSASDTLGEAVALDGALLVAGMSGHDDTTLGSTDNGAALVFEEIVGIWSLGPTLLACDRASGDLLGLSVAISGETVVAGIRGSVSSRFGGAYLWKRIGGVWEERGRIVETPAAVVEHEFGAHVAIDAGTVLASAHLDDTVATDAGAIHVGNTLDCPASWTNTGSGIGGTNGVPTLTSSNIPILCEDFAVDVTNSYGVTTTGLFLLGFTPASIPFKRCGTILLAPLVIVPIVIGPGGLTLSGWLPPDRTACGLVVYLQVIEADPGGCRGYSLTPRLDLTLGF